LKSGSLWVGRGSYAVMTMTWPASALSAITT
jgi:hypothetical protein